jgi:hypothetical protein
MTPFGMTSTGDDRAWNKGLEQNGAQQEVEKNENNFRLRNVANSNSCEQQP